MNLNKLLTVFWIVLLAGSVQAQFVDQPLPAEAQAAVDKGLAAAKQEEWSLAIKYFGAARKAAPRAPSVLFNQALAESHVPGRELRAIVLFKAYLVAFPDSPKAAAVQEQIANLQIKVEGTMNSLLEQARNMTAKFPQDERENYLSSLATARAKTGDIDGAKRLAFTLTTAKNSALVGIAKAQAVAGDFGGAESTAGYIVIDDSQYDSSRDQAFCQYDGIIVLEAAAGKIDDAKNNLRYCKSWIYRKDALIAIAKALYKAGQKEEAKQTLIQARNEITESKSENVHSDYHDVAKAQAAIDDINGALETAGLISHPQYGAQYKGWVYDAVNDAYANRVQTALAKGDIAAATKSASHMSAGNAKDSALRSISEKANASFSETLVRDPAAARDIALGIVDPQIKSKDCQDLIARFLQTNDFSSAIDLLDKITQPGAKIKSCVDVARAQYKLGKPYEALETLSLSRTTARNERPPANDWSATYDFNKALPVLAAAYAGMGISDRALETAELGADETLKADAYTAIVMVQITADNVSAAQETLALIKTNSSDACLAMAKALTAKGKLTAARQMASRVSDGWGKGSAYETIVEAQAANGDIKGAKETAASISDMNSFYKYLALKVIAREQVHRGNIADAKKTVDSMPADRIADKVAGYCDYIAHCQRLGFDDFMGANQTLDQAKEMASQIVDPEDKASAYLGIANHFMDLSDVQKNVESITLARAGALQVKDLENQSKLFASSYSSINKAMQDAGLWDQTQESVWLGLEMAQSLPEDRSKRNRLKAIAGLQASCGDLGEAKATAYSLSNSEDRDSTLADIAKLQIGFGNIAGAEKTLAEISPVNTNAQATVYQEIMCAQLKNGDLSGAKQTLFKMHPSSYANESIANAWIKTGDLQTAAPFVKAAVANGYSDSISYDFESAGHLAEAEQYAKTDWYWSLIGEAKAKAGDLDSAKKIVTRIADQGYKARVIAAIAEAGDVASAKAGFETVSLPGAQGSILYALANKGEIDWAKAQIAKNQDYYYQQGCSDLRPIIEAEVAKGNIAGAKKLALSFRPDYAFDALCNIASQQVHSNDVSGARETLGAAWKTIDRGDTDFDSWANYKIAVAKGLPSGRQVAEGIKSDFWKSKAYEGLFTTNVSQRMELALAMPDASQKGMACLKIIREVISNNQIKEAIRLAASMPSSSWKVEAAGETIAAAILGGNPSSVTALLFSLPDSAGKAYLCLNAADAFLAMNDQTNALACLMASKNGIETISIPFWKARACLKLSLVALDCGETDLSTRNLQIAESLVDNFNPSQKANWLLVRNGLTRSAASPGETASISPDKMERVQKQTDAWTALLNYPLDEALYTDFRYQLETISAKDKPGDIFYGFVNAAESLARVSAQIKQTEADLQKSRTQ
jgi:hypothetical protein